ncbi:E3 ubiquitin-protein ligase RNF135 [Cygnus atratus]|uniref:E3 ubiquitin-protein ligase RNF135 n=1 Tax=Cygnus atratus TaxID=8868 RepID=UPI0015D6588E|nr:E3 ubiquitin-protein ligase RNF135 [Cygnus atratus]
MAAQAELGRLLADVELSCSCCLQYFTEPVRLASCSHSFCRPCIDAYRRGRQRATCPLCRESFELKDLRPNRELAALVSLVLNGERGEGLGTWDEPRPSGDGAGGGWSSAGRRPGKKEEQIRDISKQLEITEETINILRKDLSKTKEYTSQIQSQITKDFCCMKEYIERQEENTLMFIEQEQKAARQKIEETIHQLCVEKNKLIAIKAQMEKGLGSDEMRWQNSNLLEREGGSPSTMHKFTIDEKFNVVRSAVGNLKRKLEILLLEEYPQQFPPVQSPALYQETRVCSLSSESAAKSPEPSISSQFSRWADIVTFDLTTAYDRLAITAQNRKVMVSSNPTYYEPSLKRFCISQVLCSQGFSTGCHYWEVITKDSDGWAVGVARETIGRRDRLGRTEHSWCVEWVGPQKQLSAWHKNQETLLCSDKPLKVGVFLELQKTVSFYAITDKEVLLHTFEINTSNPLYPAFWLYSLDKNGSLTLNHINRM